MNFIKILNTLNKKHLEENISFSLTVDPFKLRFTFKLSNDEIINYHLMSAKNDKSLKKDEFRKIFMNFVNGDTDFINLVYKKNYLNKMLNNIILK